MVPGPQSVLLAKPRMAFVRRVFTFCTMLVTSGAASRIAETNLPGWRSCATLVTTVRSTSSVA